MQRGLSAGRVQSVAVRIIVEREREIGGVQAGRVLDDRGRRRGARAAAVPRAPGQDRRQEGGARQRRRLDAASSPSSRRPRSSSRRSSARSGARTRWRRSSPRACSRRRRASCASPPRRRWRWRSACTKVSSSATRARSVSSPTCVPTRRVCPTTPSPRRATYIGERYGKEYLPDEPVVYKTKKSAQDAHEAIRPTSTQYDPETVRAPPDRGGGRQSGEAARRRGSRAPLPAHLEPLHRLPDEAGRLRSDGDRHRRRRATGCAPTARS